MAADMAALKREFGIDGKKLHSELQERLKARELKTMESKEATPTSASSENLFASEEP